MTAMFNTGRWWKEVAFYTVLLAIVCGMGATARAQSNAITITLAGQSMIRSDMRATTPAEVPVIQ